ncbi:hypothetical protein WDV93_21975 [Pantoea ananatis]
MKSMMKVLIAVAVGLSLLLLVLAWVLLRRMLLIPLNNAIIHLDADCGGRFVPDVAAGGQ